MTWIGLFLLVFIAFCVAAGVVSVIAGKGSRGPIGSTVVVVFGLLVGTSIIFVLLSVVHIRSESTLEATPEPMPALVPPMPAPMPPLSVGGEPGRILPGFTDVTILPAPGEIATVQLPSPPTEWLSPDLKAFDADVYPGLVQAAAPLARQVRATLEANRLLQNNSTGDGFVEPQQIMIAANLVAPEIRASVTKQFTEEIRQHFDKSSISTTESSPSGPFGNIVVLRIYSQNEQRTDAPWIIAASNGSLQCEARTEIGQAIVTVKYDEKPWVESFGAFTTERPNKQFIAGYSTPLASSDLDARREAMSDASEKLKQSGFNHFQLAESLACDRFVQKLSRPYGDVWRVALLFDLSSQPMATHAISTMNAQVADSQKYRSRVVAIVVLFLFTGVLCVAINLLTLGYYRMQISLGWVFAVLGLVALGGLLVG